MTLWIDTDFPGGNATVEEVDGQTIRFRPDLRDTQGHWFYWYLRVRGAAGQTLRFELTSENTLTAMGPAASLDGGRTWQWLGPAAVTDDWTFTVACPEGVEEIRLSMAMPYTRATWEAFIAGRANHPRLERHTLCRTRAGRDVPMLRLGDLGPSPAHRVLITARQHCCEVMASYVLEGLLNAVLDEVSDAGAWLSRQVQFLVVPMVDLDGVEAGDQGKNRRPRDHNRDYDASSIYPEPAALQQIVTRWAGDRFAAALDLHCPWIRTVYSQVIYLVGSKDPVMWREQMRFSEHLEARRRGPLPYTAADNLPFGQRWNVATNASQGRTCTRWAKQLGARLVSTIETPYALAGDQPVTATSARQFGNDLARALHAYLAAPSSCDVLG